MAIHSFNKFQLRIQGPSMDRLWRHFDNHNAGQVSFASITQNVDTKKARRAVHNCPSYTRSPADIASAITHHSTWSSSKGSGDQPTHTLGFERLFTHTPCSVCACVCVCVCCWRRCVRKCDTDYSALATATEGRGHLVPRKEHARPYVYFAFRSATERSSGLVCYRTVK
jgi:hypothetical protein